MASRPPNGLPLRLWPMPTTDVGGASCCDAHGVEIDDRSPAPWRVRYRCCLPALAEFTVTSRRARPSSICLSTRCGEGGIRTHGTLLGHTRFPVAHLRPTRSPLLFCPAQQQESQSLPIAVAERVGFEPTVSCPTLDFESSAFDQLGHLSSESAHFEISFSIGRRRRSRKKSLSNWAHSSARMPPSTSSRWLSRVSFGMRKSDSTAPAFGSAQP